jgi:hypothetical protein
MTDPTRQFQLIDPPQPAESGYAAMWNVRDMDGLLLDLLAPLVAIMYRHGNNDRLMRRGRPGMSSAEQPGD